MWLRAIAIALGGYPRPQQPAPSYLTDSFSDGFARGLGYLDRDDMEARAASDPEDWQRRAEGAQTALCARYEADGRPCPQGGGIGLIVAALDEWAGAKAGNPDWPEHDDSDRLARALTFYGTRPQTPEACA